MAPLSLKIILEGGAVTRVVKFDSAMTVDEAHRLVHDKLHSAVAGQDCGLFLTSADDQLSGIWLESHRRLDFYMLRDGDALHYMPRVRTLRVRMLDGSVKTLHVNESKNVEELMVDICDKIGITNHDEYGLCHEELKEGEEGKEARQPMGTLTMRRKALKERDAKIDQLSKKLKTDDNVQWLEQNKTLREMCVDPAATLLLKRRLYFSDRNVDSRDPLQLNLLYIQTRDAILDGRHPVTESQAVVFGGLQCQIQYGDFQSEKHKLGFIENLREFLPEQYSSSWGVEKKILISHRTHVGLSQLQAKLLYTKTARALPTYGVTFFAVKEKQEEKRKLVPRLLGINAESILRLDEVTKQVLQVWPLTHVKTYDAGKGDTFTLNFGEYSHKEYCVKTNHVQRIRAILDGYIDLIRRRHLDKAASAWRGSGALHEDTVERSRTSTLTHIASSYGKVEEQTAVGPCSIIQYEGGSKPMQGTQIMTVQQVALSKRQSQLQHAVSPKGASASLNVSDLIKLNIMNSKSVRIVSLLNDPSEASISELRKIVNTMETDMLSIFKGVEEAAAKLCSDEEKKKLLKELNQLSDFLKELSTATYQEKFDPKGVQKPAMDIVNLTTQMFLSLDPRTQKRSLLVRRSRQSFIEDDKTEATLRRASFVAAAAGACKAVDDARDVIDKRYDRPEFTSPELAALEAAAVDKMGKLNAAVALFLTSHSVPKDIDYPAAVTSMNTLNELMPELAKDIKSLSNSRGDDSSKVLLDNIRDLLGAARDVCMLTGTEDHQKMQDVSTEYAELSGRLIYTFGNRSPTKHNEIIDLAKDVGDLTAIVLVKANELATLAERDPAAGDVDSAGVKCAHAARDLLICAQLTAPLLEEPHCRSALTAAAENLSSSAQHLAVTWKPLVEDNHQHLGEELQIATMELANGLDRLKSAYGDLGNDDVFSEDTDVQESVKTQRLQFITSLSAAQDALKLADQELSEPMVVSQLSDQEVKALESTISRYMAQTNAAVASLLQAKSGTVNPDLGTVDLAIGTIAELLPKVISDVKAVSSSCKDEELRRAMLDDVRIWCERIYGICASADNPDSQKLEEAAQSFAKASHKLLFVFSPRANSAREQLLTELSNTAFDRAMQMVEYSKKIEERTLQLGVNTGALREKGHAVEVTAQALRSTVQLTVPTINDATCQSAIISSTDSLKSSARDLVFETAQVHPLDADARVVEDILKEQEQVQMQGVKLEQALEGIRETCQENQKSSKTRRAPPPPPRKSSIGPCGSESTENVTVKRQSMSDTQQSTQAFLTRLCHEEKYYQCPSPSNTAAGNDNTKHEKQKAQLAKTLEESNLILLKAVEELKKVHAVTDVHPPTDAKETSRRQKLLEQKLAQLNAVAATLITSNQPDATDYEIAVECTNTLSLLVPKIVEDASYMSWTRDEKSRKAFLDDIMALCDATRTLCVSTQDDAHKLNEAAVKFGDKTARLLYRYIVGTDVDPAQGKDVISRAEAIKESAARLARGGVAHAQGARSAAAQRVCEVAAALHNTAKLVAPSIQYPDCHQSLITASKDVSSNMKTYKATWTNLDSNSQDKESVEKLTEEADNLEKLLEQFVKDLQAHRLVKRKTADEKDDSKHLKMVEEENKKQFAQTIKEADKIVLQAEEELTKVYSGKNVHPPTDVNQISQRQKRMEQKLAQANAAAAMLFASKKTDSVDYKTAVASTNHISKLISAIVKDAAYLSSTQDEKSRKVFLDDILALCSATRSLCASAQDDSQKINEAAVTFGDKSARLMYSISTDVKPEYEKDVISRAKAIGDSASRLAMGGATVAMNTSNNHAQDICEAGKGCADAAGTFVYTAKLVALSIQHPECQQSLIAVSEDLLSNMKAFKSTWAPLSSDPQHTTTIEDLTKEAGNLEKLIKEFEQDLKEDKLVKRKTVEHVVLEDTPLRKLTSDIMEDAKKRAASPIVAKDKRKQFEDYAYKLSAAIQNLDLANKECKRSPHDFNKRQVLENAIQSLQFTVLQSRPTLGEKPCNNIVDLTDFLRDVQSEAEKLVYVVNKVKDDHHDKLALQDIRKQCSNINSSADKLINPNEQQTTETVDSLDGILEVDHFGQHCESIVKDIESTIQGLDEEKTKEELQENFVALSESCNLLRFASKSALSSAQSAALDAALDDLGGLEAKLDVMLKPGQAASTVKKYLQGGASRSQLSRARLGAEVRRGARHLSPALARYVADLRGCTDLSDTAERTRLQQHLKKLVQLLKLLTATTNTRVAAWQPLRAAELSNITQQILQELESNEDKVDNTAATMVKRKFESSKATVNNAGQLSLPKCGVQIKGDPKKLEEYVREDGRELNSLTGTIMSSVADPESLQTSIQRTTSLVAKLSTTASAMKTDNPKQKIIIEEATFELEAAAYDLMMTSELVCEHPADAGVKRRLLEACRMLNDSINKIIRATSSATKMRVDCDELSRGALVRGALLRAAPLRPSCALPYTDCLDAMHNQQEVLNKLKSDEPMSRQEFGRSLSYVTSAVFNGTEYAAQCAYLISISELHRDVAAEGLVDVPRAQKLCSASREACFGVLRAGNVDQVKDEKIQLDKGLQDLQQTLKEVGAKAKGSVQSDFTECAGKLDAAGKALQSACSDKSGDMDMIQTCTMNLLDCLNHLNSIIEDPTLVPVVTNVSTEVKEFTDDINSHSKSLLTEARSLIEEVSSQEQEVMTWVIFSNRRNAVLNAFDALLNALKQNGRKAGLVETPKTEVEEEQDASKKSFIQIQVELAKKWLQRRPSKPEVQAAGESAIQNIVDIAEKMAEDLTGQEKEDMNHLVCEMVVMNEQCKLNYEHDKAIVLMERVNELRKAIERCVVSRVVEDFTEAESPLADLEMYVDAEGDETKRKFLLEKKIAELLAQLGRVTRTARLVADAGGYKVASELKSTSDQTELLAPMLVQAAHEIAKAPNDKSVVENYKAMLARYSAALARVRDLCDRAVDPMDFVQTAGETMHRMRDESSHDDDPQKCAYTSTAITRLAGRVINVGISSSNARSDPELRAALAEAKLRLVAATPGPDIRRSKMPHWKDTTAEILRTTGEVESVLGGENIFKKQPEPDQPIYNAALDLHAAVRGWSARDNEIVAVAKRMAVLMARLSDHMNNDRKRELIATSKRVVVTALAVAHLSGRLARECSDARITANLLQVCDRIPTISGQLKMLTTVKGSSFGHQGLEEDKEAMTTLVGNAQNLMMSVQEVLKAAESASVKIASQRGGTRLRWVRRHYY